MLTPPLVLAHFWGLLRQIQIGESLYDTPKMQHLLYWGTGHIPVFTKLGIQKIRTFFSHLLRHWSYSYIKKTWNTKNTLIFFAPGTFLSHHLFSHFSQKKTCKCSLSWFIRDVYTWDQQDICHFLGRTMFLRSYSLIFKQIRKNPFFYDSGHFFEALNLYFCKMGLL